MKKTSVCGYQRLAIFSICLVLFLIPFQRVSAEELYTQPLNSEDALEIPIPVDIKPHHCPNPLNIAGQGVLPVAIVGTEEFDVTQVDPASVRLEEEVAPIRSTMKDVATPFEPFMPKEDCYEDCNNEGSDGYTDLILKFNIPDVVAVLGNVEEGDCIILNLTGNLYETFGGTPIVGEDLVLIIERP